MSRRAGRMATALVVAALALGGAGVLASSLGGDTGPVLDRLGHIAAIAGVPVASAQPHPHPHPPGTPPHGQNRAPQRPGAGAGAANAERARAPAESTLASKAFRGNSRAGSMLFWLFAALMIAGAVFVITRRNLITAVMGMVGTFFAIAATYAMLYAKFLAAIQVLVYAGAIMVLFVFVIMILNKPEAEPWGLEGIPGKLLAGIGLLYLFIRLSLTLWSVKPPDEALVPPIGDFGSTKALGTTLFTDYLFPFEAVSLVLLIAVVGAVAIARPHESGRGKAPSDDGDGAEGGEG